MPHAEKKQPEKWTRLTISSLEADVAYFDARLALLDEETTNCHQLAQLKAYRELERVLSEMLARLKGQPKRTAGSTGIEVSIEPGTGTDEDQSQDFGAKGLNRE